MKIVDGVLTGVEFGDNEILEKGKLSIKESTGVKKIAPFAFEANNEIAKFKCTNNLEEIGSWAFYDSDVKFVDYSESSSLKAIKEGTFNNCANLSVVKFNEENTIESIGDLSFAKCQMLSGIKLPDGLKYIGKNAFYDCSNLIYVRLPNSVRFLDDGAFEKCKQLEEISLPRHIEKIGNDVLNNTGVKKITVYSVWPDFKGKVFELFDREFKEVTIKDRESKQKFTVKAQDNQHIKVSYDGKAICGLFNEQDNLIYAYYVEDGKLACKTQKELKQIRSRKAK